MANVLKLLWSVATYQKRKRAELEKQKSKGYSIVSSGGPDAYLDYRDGDKALIAEVSWEGSDCKIVLRSANGWEPVTIYSGKEREPVKGRELTPEEASLVVSRIREYLIVEGARNVTLGEVSGMTMDELFENLGWEARDEGGQVKYVRKSHRE
jgi:hypothetical protein